MGGAVASLGSAIASGAQSVGSHIASGAKALYGDEKNYLQTGSPTSPGHDPTMTQSLLFGTPQQSGPTPAQQLRRNQLANS